MSSTFSNSLDKFLYEMHDQYSSMSNCVFSILDEDNVIEFSSNLAYSLSLDTLRDIVDDFGEEKIQSHYVEKYGSLPEETERMIEFVTEILTESYF